MLKKVVDPRVSWEPGEILMLEKTAGETQFFCVYSPFTTWHTNWGNLASLVAQTVNNLPAT